MPLFTGCSKAMADSNAHIYEPSVGHGLSHDPLNAIVGPRPIGWISSLDAQGNRNLAPYSFFNAFNYTPPIIGFASTGWKDSVANIKDTGEFVWNLATEELASAMNQTSAMLPRERDEFEFGGLTPASSVKIKAPRVLESPVNFECRLSQLIQLQSAAGEPVPTWLVLGEVVAIHIDRRLIRDGIYQALQAKPILRWGGRGDYIRVAPENVFQMLRPAV
jgi:flavin reductase (DIM6/NTAB) family NADH-FMN oxidoreductase RutF